MGHDEHGNQDEREIWSKLFSGQASDIDLNALIPKDLSGKDAIHHAEDAVDYEGENELAEEDDCLEPADTHVPERPDNQSESNWLEDLDENESQASSASPHGLHVDNAGGLEVLADIVDGAREAVESGQQVFEEIERENEAELLEALDPRNDEDLLNSFYPGFRRGAVLKMHSFFGPKSGILSLPKPKVLKPCLPLQAQLDVQIDQSLAFKFSGSINSNKRRRCYTVEDSYSLEELKSHYFPAKRPKGKDLFSCKDQNATWMSDPTSLFASADWDSIFSADTKSDQSCLSLSNTDSQSLRKPRLPSLYYDLVYGSDEEEVILGNRSESIKRKVCLDLNDPHLLLAESSASRNISQGVRNINVARIPASEEQLVRKYNISNDRAYDMLKENYQKKVRSTIGNLSIDHSLIAMRLQSPHYKVKLSKAQMRSHHRPSFYVKPGTHIQFTKLRQRKRKKDKGKHVTELLAKSTDLTLADTASYFLMEYSEEFPLALNGFGMGSKIINYYRKTSQDDNNRPRFPIGETGVLSPQDRSAFWNFGFVEPGKVVPTLYNRMIRAPIFQHKPYETDFLLIRTTNGKISATQSVPGVTYQSSSPRYFLKPLNYLFVIGQTFPATLIPGPHSRKVTTASKNRLKMVAYRVLNKNPRQRLLVRDISPHFPDQNEMQNRQRLKEFMEYQRSGEDQHYWKVKPGEALPTEDAIRSMITPEDVMLLETMQVGQQRLEDAGYGKATMDENAEDESMSVEQLAPWNVSRNFINATQGKAMLQLHGAGDPSSRGETFSFLRTSMKGGFRAQGESVNEQIDKNKYNGHSYNVAMQQKAYDEEIARIWYAQKRSLQIKDPKLLGWDEAESRRDHMLGHASKNAADLSGQIVDDDGNMSIVSQSSAQSSTVHGNKALRLTRFFKDANGTLQRKVEFVTDPNVIRVYIKRRHELEDEALAVDDISVTNDEEKNKRSKLVLKKKLAKLQRNMDRRNARNALKASTDPNARPGAKGKTITRKCATCGAVGHIKTNKSCPMYNHYMGEASVGKQSAKKPSLNPPLPFTT